MAPALIQLTHIENGFNKECQSCGQKATYRLSMGALNYFFCETGLTLSLLDAIDKQHNREEPIG